MIKRRLAQLQTQTIKQKICRAWASTLIAYCFFFLSCTDIIPFFLSIIQNGIEHDQLSTSFFDMNETTKRFFYCLFDACHFLSRTFLSFFLSFFLMRLASSPNDIKNFKNNREYVFLTCYASKIIN